VRYTAPLADTLLAPLEDVSRDYSKEKPVNDAIFGIYRSFYSYDRTDLRAAVESVDDTPKHWRRETITFDAVYGNERVMAYLFLPKNGVPPYQIVIYFPGSISLVARSSEELELQMVDFFMRSGRALLYPVYKGTYERRLDPSLQGPSLQRDRVVYWSKDLGRSIDYLETRADIDRGRLAYYGNSLGGIYGPVLTAIDGRIKVSVQIGGGFVQGKLPPEIDPLHFAPRAKEPVLMIAGRHDFARPVESCQMPMFRLLGAPAKDKRIVLIDTGHVIYPSQHVIKETLDWLDRYLGPVRTN
jgi:cephalosporin-C deacetylase-like acetyl esterase